MNKKSKYLMKNTFLFGISSFSSKILTFLLVPLYTSVLTTGEYGIADLIVTTDNLLIYLFTLNISEAVFRFAIEKKSDKSGIFLYGIKIVLIGSIFVIIGIFFSSILLENKWPNYCYYLMFLYYIVAAISQLFVAFARALDMVKEIAISSVISSVLLVVTNVIFLIVIKIGLLGYLLSLVISSIGFVFYLLIHIISGGYIDRYSLCEATIRSEMKKYSIPLVFNGICWWVNNSIDKYFLNVFWGASYVGIYSISYKIPLVLFMIQSIFSQAWNLSIVKMFDYSDNDGFIAKTYRNYNGVLVFFSSILIMLSIPLAKLLFAKEFFEAWIYSAILIIASLFSALGAFAGGVFVAIKDSKGFSLTTVVAAVVNFILNLILIPKFHLYGAAIATVISFAIMWGLRIYIVIKVVDFKLDLLKNVLSYIVLILQVYIELSNPNDYWMQIVLFIVLLYLNIKTALEGGKCVYRGLNRFIN